MDRPVRTLRLPLGRPNEPVTPQWSARHRRSTLVEGIGDEGLARLQVQRDLLALAALQHLAHLFAQVDGEVRMRIVDRLVLADEATQFGRDLEHARFEHRVGRGRRGLLRSGRAGQQREHRGEQRATH